MLKGECFNFILYFKNHPKKIEIDWKYQITRNIRRDYILLVIFSLIHPPQLNLGIEVCKLGRKMCPILDSQWTGPIGYDKLYLNWWIDWILLIQPTFEMIFSIQIWNECEECIEKPKHFRLCNSNWMHWSGTNCQNMSLHLGVQFFGCIHTCPNLFEINLIINNNSLWLLHSSILIVHCYYSHFQCWKP